MRIVVDNLPSSCSNCPFIGFDNRMVFCKLTEKVVKQYDKYGHLISNYKEGNCPLVEFSELLKNT